MHFDYRADAPIDFDCRSFMDKRRLLCHRDSYMGDAAAALAVYSDGEKCIEKCKSSVEAAELLYRQPISSLSAYKRKYAADIRERAGEYLCHRAFFSSLGETARAGNKQIAAIEKSFGSVEQFRYSFVQNAAGQKKPGYLWLIKERRGRQSRLCLRFTDGSALPPPQCKAVLCLDLWEHAYFEIFGTDKGAYAAAFLSCADLSGADI